MGRPWHRHDGRVQYKDTDQMGVVHHGNYITWFEVGRTEWMRAQGVAYHRLEAAGLRLPVLDVQASYMAAAHFDERYAVFTRVGLLTPTRLRFLYEVRRLDGAGSWQPDCEVPDPQGELLARGSTTHVFVGPAMKTVRVDRVAPEIYGLLRAAVDGTPSAVPDQAAQNR